MEDQRKRTMEALERRFAQAETEIRTQQQKIKRRPINDKDKFASNIESSPSNVATKKLFTNASYRKDTDADEPAYLKLSHPVQENLLPAAAEVSDSKTVVDHVLHKLFQHGDSAKKYMQGAKSIKIENTILLDNFVHKNGKSNGARASAMQNGSKRSKKHMSLKQHKKIGSFDLPREFHNFEIFKPMHEKWKSYTQQLLKISRKDQLAQYFMNADLHGAIILVVQCKIAAYVGIHGIMLRETKETFGIITQDNKFRVVPKKLSVFILQADCWKITLVGDTLASRNLVP